MNEVEPEKISIKKLGSYRVISEEEYSEMQISYQVFLLAKPTIGYLIRHFRKSQKLSQKDVAVWIGKKQKYIDSLEQGHIKNISQNFFDILSGHFGEDFQKVGTLLNKKTK